MGDDRNKLEAWGCRVSSGVADLSAHPFAQIALIAFCVAWFALRLPVEILTAALSILAITLTQMVLNQQKERSADAHRRDVALHAKLDELVHASRRARDDLMGAEELDEDEIARLKQAMRTDPEAVSQDSAPRPVTAPPAPAESIQDRRPGLARGLPAAGDSQFATHDRPYDV